MMTRDDRGFLAMAAALFPTGAFLLVIVVISTGSIAVDKNGAREYSSFMGWYAFILACCAVPTACACRQGWREAIEMREDLERMRQRMAKIERSGWGGGVILGRSSGEGGDAARPLRNLCAPENRDREWEFLEGMFSNGGGGGEDKGQTTRGWETGASSCTSI